ncbi:MAG: GNAT family N-acetyltransferase [Parvibaculaceae bacterium]
MTEAVEEFAGHTDSDDVRFTYSRPEQPFTQRALIRAVEALTGQPRLERLYRNWARHPWPGENIFAAAMRLLEIEIDTDPQAWARLPAKSPLLIVANHPFGVIDGMALGHLATQIGPDTRITSKFAAAKFRVEITPTPRRGGDDLQASAIPSFTRKP